MTTASLERRYALPAARALSIIFTPFYLPLVAVAAVLSLTYLSVLPLTYRAGVLLLTYLFTVLAPTMLIHWWRTWHGWTLFHIRQREKRMVPYLISITLYLAYYELLLSLHAPHFMWAIIVAALMVQTACALINLRLKISTHTAATGGFAGGIVAFSLILGFNAMPWLSAAIIASGLVGTARMMLRVHSLTEIVAGFLIGVVVSFTTVILV